GNARQPGGLADHHRGGAVQQPLGVEDVVDLLVLQQAVGVDARPGDVEIPAHKGGVLGNVVADLVLEVPGDVGDGGGVHAVQSAPEAGVLEHHGLQRDVARALADAQQGAVDGAGAVHPGVAGVGGGQVEVVVAVPLQAPGGHVGVVAQAVDDARHAPGQGGSAVGHAQPQGVAGPDLHGDAGLTA